MLQQLHTLAVFAGSGRHDVVYGGGGIGLMRKLADAVMRIRGKNNRCNSFIHEG